MPITLKRRRPNPDLQFPDSLHPLLRRIYSQRDLSTVDELDLTLNRLLPPDTLKGMEGAVDLLVDAFTRGRSILVVADFDADGATSCALALQGLRALGARRVDYIVPNRFDYGYGLTPEIVALAAEREPDLIITVDNGISSVAGVQAAQDRGIQVLITDHHLAGATLPPAEAIVNPNQPGCGFASKAIAGVGVMFYVLLALRTRLRESGWFAQPGQSEPNLADFLDLVALGTVADVVALDHNNRILVEAGLRRIRGRRTRAGILALLEIAGRRPEQVSASDLGFQLGPRLNAAGRLQDMSTGIECLLAADSSTAYQLALQLDGMNRDRKQIESTMREQAMLALAEVSLAAEDLPPALCLFDARWHQGVVGILAARVKERLHRPVIAFAVASAEDSGGELKGSARSIPGFHIRDALDAIATRHPGLISKFGGHAMAAGLSLSRENLSRFEVAFVEEAANRLSADQLQGEILSDGVVASDLLSLHTAQLLQAAGPWGQAFPEPLFDGEFLLRGQRLVGEKHLKLRLSPMDMPDRELDAIAFNVEEADRPWPGSNRLHLAYRLDCNEYGGRTSLQLVIETILAIDD